MYYIVKTSKGVIYYSDSISSYIFKKFRGAQDAKRDDGNGINNRVNI